MRKSSKKVKQPKGGEIPMHKKMAQGKKVKK